MNYAVIDIGTNTIRSVIYNENLLPVAQIVAESVILQHTENHMLTTTGIDRLCKSLADASAFFKQNNADKIFCFATSAMRDVKNFDEVNNAVKTECGFEIDLLSEKAEAISDFTSLKFQLGDDCSGVGADLGGGSCQVILFNHGELIYHCSHKLGVKRLYNKFGELTRENEATVRNYIIETISDIPPTKSNVLYIMGGTSNKIRKLIKHICGVETITPEHIRFIIKQYYNQTSQYKSLSTTEFYKIPFGAIVIDTLCKVFDAKSITVMSGGAREGYIAQKLYK